MGVWRSAAETRRLLEVATGREPAERVLVGGRLLNVYTGEVLEGWGAATAGEWTAYVGPRAEALAGPGTEVVDLRGRYLVPGLVDGHTHNFWRLDPWEVTRAALAGGTTAWVTEVMELAGVVGAPAVAWALEAARGSPAHVLINLPALSSLLPEDRPACEVEGLLGEDEVAGLGEVSWVEVALRRPEAGLLERNAAAARARRAVEGHGAGARGDGLVAFAAAGYGSCHESITAGDLVDRLRLGMRAMIRQGSIRQDLDSCRDVRAAGVDTAHLLLVTDGVGPEDLERDGYLDAALRRALELGFTPLEAYRMAALRPAQHFGLVDVAGGVAPGRWADMSVVREPGAVPDLVFARGRLAAREGEPLVEGRTPPWPAAWAETAGLGRAFGPQDLALPEGEARLVDQVAELVTREGRASFAGRLPEGVLHAVCAGRGRNAGRFFHGFVRGFGLREGAMASTMAWDTCATLAVGADPADVALALNRTADLRGGLVLTRGGRVLWELPAPAAGMITPGPLRAVASGWRRGRELARGLGCPWREPFLSLEVLSTALIPHLRLSYRGYVRVKDGAVLGW